ncbi:uncharacterized protein PGTG_14015 [Puccinia graminis f. sp. tritici CRL 75-36-700-3]|uniref:Uncharacterized protein n=1 Tax=Puccinia graminis f. sp. tritici (strain CRL 75-36-700-3 / race SCCL) TaxID=418459 RepID=E3KVW2_PUCGT|nr:uncharacterized protein PGTG_14015 [Puccinia graminis f. sp. tritici CRL 75-36-700-3]EFP88437.2 hypothetical protein PGTG_14015 [Puccinia graminis f. sp. tritici CRL 75-36-700-3]
MGDQAQTCLSKQLSDLAVQWVVGLTGQIPMSNQMLDTSARRVLKQLSLTTVGLAQPCFSRTAWLKLYSDSLV